MASRIRAVVVEVNQRIVNGEIRQFGMVNWRYICLSVTKLYIPW